MGGSGGGSSGEVGYPDHMENVHNDWLRGPEDTTIGSNVNILMNAAMGESPYDLVDAHKTETARGAIVAMGNVYQAYRDALDNPQTMWENTISAVATAVDAEITDAAMEAEITAYDDIVDDRTDTETVPGFQAGYRDINAVMSSSFVIGQSVIEGFADRDKNKFAADLRLASYNLRNQMIDKGIAQVSTFHQFLDGVYDKTSRISIEGLRIGTIFAKEEVMENLDIDDKDLRWDLDMFQYGCNVMASIAGAASRAGKEPSQMQSALGGALSGAAAGAMVMPANPLLGGAIGGAVGLGASLLG